MVSGLSFTIPIIVFFQSICYYFESRLSSVYNGGESSSVVEVEELRIKTFFQATMNGNFGPSKGYFRRGVAVVYAENSFIERRVNFEHSHIKPDSF